MYHFWFYAFGLLIFWSWTWLGLAVKCFNKYTGQAARVQNHKWQVQKMQRQNCKQHLYRMRRRSWRCTDDIWTVDPSSDAWPDHACPGRVCVSCDAHGLTLWKKSRDTEGIGTASDLQCTHACTQKLHNWAYSRIRHIAGSYYQNEAITVNKERCRPIVVYCCVLD